MTDSNGRILIVDDERLNITVLAALLEEDYEILVAKDGEQALKRARGEHKPDLILLDVVMPNMDGYEVCQILKKDSTTQHIPVIFITVKSTVEEETRGLELGAVDYIAKPFSPAIVKARVANHVELKRQRDLLQHLNITDALTNIANRRYFDGYLEHELEQCQNASIPLSLIMIDIDHFKHFNDEYGHTIGDQCLKQVAKALASELSQHDDLVARYGGEEFAVVLPKRASQAATEIAETLRQAVGRLLISTNGGQNVNVTISLGVVSYHGACTPTELIEQADQALYQSKKQGRNCVNTGS